MGDSYEARALTSRTPQLLTRNDPFLQNCLSLLRAVWQHKHDQVYGILRNLPWPETLRPLVQRYEGEIHKLTIKYILC